MNTPPHASPRVGGLLLAAGASVRMGRPKLLLPLAGEPAIAHVLRAAMSRDAQGMPLLAPVWAVVGPHAPAALLRRLRAVPRLRVACAEDAAQGQAHSLRAGLDSLLRAGPTPEGLCVLLGDQPLVDGAVLTTLIRAFRARPSAFVVPTFAGCRGNPVIIPRAFFPHVLSLSGDTGARPLFRHPQAEVCAVEMETDAVLLDMDTPEAYAALRARAEHLAKAAPLA